MVADDDPRILREDLPSDSGTTITRELIRVNGLIFIRLTMKYASLTTVAGRWELLQSSVLGEEIRTFSGDTVYQVSTPNPDHAEFSALLDRHEIELEHRLETGVPALSEGAL